MALIDASVLATFHAVDAHATSRLPNGKPCSGIATNTASPLPLTTRCASWREVRL